jgi:hypothetical protein
MAAGGGGAASPAGSRARLSAGSPADLQSVAGLQRQVELLQRDIEQHVATETMFQNVNIQLRERLELFQRQNQENVDRAEEEISRLHNELAQMAAERARMAGELESLRPLVGQLAQSRENERAVQQQRERVQSELDDTVAALGTARDEVARLTNEHQYVSNMASQYLGELRKMVSQQESREVRLDRMLELRRQHASRMAFAMMRRFVRVAALERKVAARRNAQLLRESHARWAARMALEQRVQALQARANRERLVLAFARVRLLRTLGIAERRQWVRVRVRVRVRERAPRACVCGRTRASPLTRRVRAGGRCGASPCAAAATLRAALARVSSPVRPAGSDGDGADDQGGQVPRRLRAQLAFRGVALARAGRRAAAQAHQGRGHRYEGGGASRGRQEARLTRALRRRA